MNMQPMQHIMQRGQTCLIAALAMAWGTGYDTVVTMLGHDGTRIQDGGLSGIHPQEVIDIVSHNDVAMVIIEYHPTYKPKDTEIIKSVWTDEQRETRLRKHLENRWTVLIGQNKHGAPHAVAYDGKEIFDPASSIRYPLEDFTIKEAWLFFHTL